MTETKDLNEAVSINVTRLQARVLKNVLQDHVLRLQRNVSGKDEYARWANDFDAIMEELRLASE
jgi:hypothetical protein